MRQLLLRVVFLWLVSAGLAPVAQAQMPDSLRNVSEEVARRLQQRPSDLVRVVQVRELLREQVQHGSVRAIPRLLAYLQQPTPDTTVALRPYEEWALLTVSGDVYAVADKLRRFGRTPLSARQQQRYQQLPDDQLFDLTARRIASRQDTLRGIIRQARFLPEDSTFLEVFVTLLATADSSAAAPAQQQAVRGFLAQYPASEYAGFLQQFAAPEYKASRFSYGLDFHSGSAILLGDLPTYFQHGANLGVAFELGWDRYQLYLRDYIGLGRTRQAFDYNGAWRSGMRVNYVVPEASVGYRLLDGPRLRVVPFVGVAGFFISPANSREDNPDNDLELTFRNPLTAGLNLDVLLWPTSSRTALGYETGTWLLKLRAGVRQGPARHDAHLRGGIIYLDLGIGGFGRMMRRR